MMKNLVIPAYFISGLHIGSWGHLSIILLYWLWGAKAPDFKLTGTDGKIYTLENIQQGKTSGSGIYL